VVLIRTEPAEAARPEWWEACTEVFQAEFRAASLMAFRAAFQVVFPECRANYEVGSKEPRSRRSLASCRLQP